MNLSKVKFGFVCLFLLSSKILLAQNTGISDEIHTPEASAVLDVYSTSKGMLVPRVKEVERTAIATPAIGLLVYQTDGTTPGFYYYTGTTWTPIASGSGSRWTPEAGTTNIYYNTGFVGVGVTNPRNPLVVSNTLEIRRTGTATPDISQLLFSNTAVQGNFRIGGDGGDLFWQGGGGQALQMGSYHATVLIGDRQDNVFPGFIPGGTYPNRSVVIRSSRDVSIPLTIQGNSASQSGNLTEWLNSAGTTLNVMNSTGSLGLGVTAPTQKLDVAGNLKFSGALMPDGAPGTAGYVLQSAGANASPVWIDPITTNSALNWTLSGNNLTGIRNLGTTSNVDLPFITNNVEKMRITAAGNVGIGNTAPSEKLDVAGNFRLSGAFMPNNLPGVVGSILQSGGAGVPPTWVAPGASSNWALSGNSVTALNRLGTISNFDLPFITNDSEKLRLTTTGYLGLGTASPASKFHVVTSGGTGGVEDDLSFDTYTGTGVGATSVYYRHSRGTAASPANLVSNDVLFDLIGNGYINGNFTNSSFLRSYYAGSGTDNLSYLTLGTSNAEQMRISPTGNVGIGITAPVERLDVTGNFKLTGAFMPNGNGGTAGQVLQSAGVNTSPVWVTAGASSNWALGGNSVAALNTLGTTSAFDLPFITNNTEKMRILSGGNIGINTTTPSERLEVNGNLKINAANLTTPRKLIFANSGADPDAVIEVRPGGAPEQQEMLFYVGNDPANAYGPDRIRMVAEEIRFQNFNNDTNAGSSLANAESQPASLNTRMIINPAGNVGIGTTTFDATYPEKLLVNAGTTTSMNAIVARGNINSYFQTNIQNLSTGNQSSSDIVATANNGTETTNFVNLGINGSNFTYQTGNNITTGGPNDGYLISAGQNFYIANNNTAKDIVFLAGGNVSTNNEAMRITATKRIGIGTNAPTSTLSVGGSLTMAVRTESGNTTLTATDHVVFKVGTTAGNTFTLPDATTCTGRIYRVVNHSSQSLAISPAVRIGRDVNTGAIITASSLDAGAAVELISDGTNWRRMDD